jgi:ATP/maltotriose-dependent transcriptional regulator MalT
MRLEGLAIQTAGTREKLEEAVKQGDRWLGRGNMGQPCSISFRIASTRALIETGKLEQAKRRLEETERVAGMWNGGSWEAAVWEARGLLRQSQGHPQQAMALFEEAATRYAGLSRPRDQERCLLRAENAAKFEVKEGFSK